MLLAFSQKTSYFELPAYLICLPDLDPKSDWSINFPGTSSGRVIVQGLFRYSWKLSLNWTVDILSR